VNFQKRIEDSEEGGSGLIGYKREPYKQDALVSIPDRENSDTELVIIVGDVVQQIVGDIKTYHIVKAYVVLSHDRRGND
jgi:hypothetical protein